VELIGRVPVLAAEQDENTNANTVESRIDQILVSFMVEVAGSSEKDSVLHVDFVGSALPPELASPRRLSYLNECRRDLVLGPLAARLLRAPQVLLLRSACGV
jgi:hypothetical protein